MTKIFFKKVVKELKLVTFVVTSRYGDRWKKLFSGHKPCYDSQWPAISLSAGIELKYWAKKD